MEHKEKRDFHPIYILAAAYVICMYLFPIIYYMINQNDDKNMWSLLIPFVFGLINFIVIIVRKNEIDRVQFLNCAVIIKYALIPLYIIGGFCVVISLLLMFTPVVFMIFVGPIVAVTFSILGWIIMVGAAPYTIAYIVKSCKQGVHGKALSIATAICQFFFIVDVISIMILALKEKRYVKITIAILSIFILATLVFAIGLITLIYMV